ncbi:hypothetical protein SM124_15815 [Bacillus sp. 31A1R]|uniref:Uncharacterized protein n=1 Tax=Robertmurraya mangrovi TaxID=3098077 RepID=A0ABU5J1D7_9BACI|nr:hypothetical protein [Bacillus sp. 31A1R]MDZ5473185.1 hypothetical protein [Bacillus sp. 31A1R]
MISNGYTVTKKKKTDFIQKLVPTAIILILSSVFLPIFFLGPIQGLIYQPKGYWLYEPPKSAYVTFIICVLVIAFLLILFAFLASKGAINRITKSLIVISTVASIAVIILCFNNYHYVDKEGIHINPLFGFEEKSYSWDEVTEARQTVKVKMGIMSGDELILSFNDGNKYALLLNSNVIKARVAMYFELEEERGIKIIYEDAEGQS